MPQHKDISHLEPESYALNLMPESLARSLPVLAVTTSADSIHVMLPTASTTSESIACIRAALGIDVTYDTAPSEQILAAIDRHYPRPAATPPNILLPTSIPTLNTTREFSFLGVIGQLSRQTKSSASFILGRWRGDPPLDLVTMKHHPQFTHLGWLDAHFPCSGDHKLFVRCSIADRSLSYELIRSMVSDVLTALSLPTGVTWIASIDSGTSRACTSDPEPVEFSWLR